MMHHLKILPAFFESAIRGEKNFEIRNNDDRGFQKGDTVYLIEQEKETPTGRAQLVEITYVSNYNQPSNQVVFGFSLTGDVIEE
ncbi:MAG: hypothetical protein ACJA2A_002080 [Cycloclasticus pugetii]|jgi:hypothetical protein